ncbi:hypothetical protein OWM07_06565 [Deferribacter thermophilus]|uniref:tetratricopeptide repeat protein n=1 Tax=Deferribacter thermophilus TaxID=53573 RepID=UPI003C1C1B02
MRSLLKEVMLFCIVTILVSCVSVKVKEPEAIKGYSVLYYITKKADDNDIRFYKKLINSDNLGNRNNGYVLLGGHYYKTHKYKKSIKLLEKYKSEDESLEYARLLWLFDIYIRNHDKKSADSILISLLKFNNKDGLSALICSQYEVKEYGNRCITELYNNTFKKVVKINKKEEIKKREVKEIKEESTNIIDNNTVVSEDKNEISNIFDDSKICVITKNFESDLIKGMLLNIKINNLDFKIDFKNDCDGRWLINSESQKIGDKLYNEVIDFSFDFNEEAKEIENYLYLNDIDNFYIISSQVDNFSEREIINDDKNFLKQFFITFNDESDNESDFYFVYVGKYDKIFEKVPLIKYFAKYPDNINLFVGTDFLDTKLFDENFYSYFKGSIIVTPVCLVCSEDNKNFYYSYKQFYNMEPNFEAIVGYDIITYVNNEINEHFYSSNYLSGIKGIKNNTVYRDFNFYKIIGKKRIKKLIN